MGRAFPFHQEGTFMDDERVDDFDSDRLGDERRADDPNGEGRGDHPVGTTIGTGAGATAGAVVGGALGGPLGAVAGAVVGGAVGGAAGHVAAEGVDRDDATGAIQEDDPRRASRVFDNEPAAEERDSHGPDDRSKRG
jgi:hypothetical protein